MVAFVEGTLFVFFRLAEGAAVRLVVPAPQYPQALAQNEARLRGASLLGPLGGILFDVGRAVPFLADAVSYLVSLGTLLLNPAPFQEERTDRSRRLVNEIREGMAWLWHQRLIRATVLLAAGSNPLFQALFLVVIVLAKSHGASASVIGLMLGGFGLGGVLGSLAGPWIQRRLPPRCAVKKVGSGLGSLAGACSVPSVVPAARRAFALRRRLPPALVWASAALA